MFKSKVAWLIKPLVFLSAAFAFISLPNATAGMVWKTLNAPLVNGNIVSANSGPAGGKGQLVSVDYNDPRPNPCYGTNTQCFFSIYVFTNSTKYTYVAAGYDTPNEIKVWFFERGSHPKTLGELYRALQQRGLNAGYTVTGYNRPYYCDPTLPGAQAGCIFNSNKWEAYSKVCYALIYGVAYGGSGPFEPVPGQGCIGPTPPNNECHVDAGSVTLNHGELTTDAVNGHRKSENVRISCTYPANANLAVYSSDANEKIMLKSDNSLYSTVTIDGVAGITGKKINIPQEGATINLESTLHAVGNVEAGAFSGTAILVINNY
ncbi:hypothetical protein V2T44_07650 [Serratia ficaria]|uniref:MrpH family fimbial adhesin n=1 Tax=Serratia ficaria TaxID=61651 RepID=UPI002ED696C5|nr:hypothetical protein [Serratia ficaria]